MSESERPPAEAGGLRIPPGETELKDRLRAVIGEESQAAFARRAGVAESVLRKYLAGAQPSTDRLVALADAGMVSIEWLASGRGARTKQSQAAAPLSDRARLASAVRGVEEGLEAIGKRLPPAKKAELICAAYDLLSEGSPQASAQIIKFIRLAA